MAKNSFESQDQVARVLSVLDGIARRAWERPSVDDQQKRAVGRAMGEFYIQLQNACRDLPREANRDLLEKPPRGHDVDKGNWAQFARDELIDMIGREDIRSIADAFLKTKPLLRALQATGHARFLFRGQRDITWRLLPRLAEALDKADLPPPTQHLDEQQLTRTLPVELKRLADFRGRWKTLEGVEDVDRKKQLADDHPEWWFRMQHYEGGTRLLDVTTSLNAALLFACVDWASGLVDETTDGIIYLWPEGVNTNVDDFLIRPLPPTAEELFIHPQDAPRLILNPPHNERSRARVSTAERLPGAITSFLADFESLDVRHQKAQLQAILKSAYVYRDERLELEFRG